MSAVISWRDLRVLAAIRPRDGVTGAALAEPLAVGGDGLTVIRNPSGLYVIARARGFEGFADAFAQQPPDPRPAVEDAFTVAIDDPARRWLPRLARIVLPRDPTALPASARQLEGSLFRPVDVELLPAATAATATWWAVLRVRVEQLVDGSPQGVRGALLRLRAAPDAAPRDGVADAPPGPGAPVLAYGLSDARGEALVAVPALPAHTFASTVVGGRSADDGDPDADPATPDTPVVTFDTPCVLDAVADPAAPWPFDHSALAGRFGDASLPRASLALALRAGDRQARTLTLAITP